MIAYDRENPDHPRLRDVWGRTYHGRDVRVEVRDVGETIRFRYVSSRRQRRSDLPRFLADWSLLSRWPGLEKSNAPRRMR